jgi:hypothetical protein
VEDYYVYVYLNPLKNGKMIYCEYSFDFEPFYVGKGRNNRASIHFRKVKNGNYSNLPKYHLIKKILDEGKEPIIIKYKKNMSEADAFKLEEDMILKIGRTDLGKGPLRNLSNGGEGNGNRIFTEEHRKNLSISKKGTLTESNKKHLKEIHKAMIGNKRTLGLKFSQETKNKMSQSRSKPIVQKDLEGNNICEFKSIKEAKERTGIKSIAKVLRGGGKTAGGFIWEYKDNNR